MTEDRCSIFHHCLYFTANALARAVTRLAEEEFALAGIAPSYAFLMMLVNETPGITQKELAEKLVLAPSTVTRFIDTLVHKGYLERKAEGKLSKIYPTKKGEKLQKAIDAAWLAFYNRYIEILGQDASHELARMMDQASQKLEG